VQAQLRRFRRPLLLMSAVLMFVMPFGLLAADHVVSPADLRSELAASAQARQQDLATLRSLLASEPGRKALAAAHVDPSKVDKALPMLSDQELSRLAATATQAQKDFAAGSLSLTNEQLTIIIVGVLLIIIVAIIAT
jgi:hypothetical protein